MTAQPPAGEVRPERPDPRPPAEDPAAVEATDDEPDDDYQPL